MKLIISILLVAILSACSNERDIITIEPIKTTATVAPAPKPGPVSLKPVEFIVVTKDTRSKMDSNRVWYVISVDTYENLAFNTQEMLRVIREQKAAIKYYEGLYITAN
jgi:uncharacterized lipoprotein YajG